MFFSVFFRVFGLLYSGYGSGGKLIVNDLFICLVLNVVLFSILFYNWLVLMVLLISVFFCWLCDIINRLLIMLFRCCVLVLICFSFLFLLLWWCSNVVFSCRCVSGVCSLWEILESRCCWEVIMCFSVVIIWLKLVFVVRNFCGFVFSFGCWCKFFWVILLVVFFSLCVGFVRF